MKRKDLCWLVVLGISVHDWLIALADWLDPEVVLQDGAKASTARPEIKSKKEDKAEELLSLSRARTQWHKSIPCRPSFQTPCPPQWFQVLRSKHQYNSYQSRVSPQLWKPEQPLFFINDSPLAVCCNGAIKLRQITFIMSVSHFYNTISSPQYTLKPDLPS